MFASVVQLSVYWVALEAVGHCLRSSLCLVWASSQLDLSVPTSNSSTYDLSIQAMVPSHQGGSFSLIAEGLIILSIL